MSAVEGAVTAVSDAGIERKRWLALAVIVTAQFMVVLDVAIVNVALPSIKTDLNFSQESLQWVITAYSIFFGGFLLLGGRLADLFGRRRLFMAGLLLFTVSSLLNGLAWSEASLIAFRSLQGLGAAMLSPAALSILTTTFQEGRERNRALGIWGAVAGSGGAVGVREGAVGSSSSAVGVGAVSNGSTGSIPPTAAHVIAAGGRLRFPVAGGPESGRPDRTFHACRDAALGLVRDCQLEVCSAV
jgi:MFS family permease